MNLSGATSTGRASLTPSIFRERPLERRARLLAEDREHDPLEAASRGEVARAPPRPRSAPPPRPGSRRRRSRRRPARATGRPARPPCAACCAVASRMISADVGPPSSIVAAWITQRDGSSPAPVSTASPRPIGALRSLSSWIDAPAGAHDRARDAAAVLQLRVGRVGDRVDLQLRDVGLAHLHRSATRSFMPRRPRGVQPGAAVRLMITRSIRSASSGEMPCAIRSRRVIGGT